NGMDDIARFLAGGLDIRLRATVADISRLPADTCVVALPPRAALDLVPAVPQVSEPCLAVVAGYRDLEPPMWPGLFVNDDPVLQWVAVDSSKRPAPDTVLVAHLRGAVRPSLEDFLTALSEVVDP